MSKKRRKSRNYDITGVVEVINITPGRRMCTTLDLDDPILVENTHNSGSIVIKRAIYETSAIYKLKKEKIPTLGSGDEG